VKGLKKQFHNAPDSKRLVEKVQELVGQIRKQVREWDF
jgi:hypothetical protein